MSKITKMTIVTNIICCAAILFISIGYSSFSKTLTMADILASISPDTEIKIDNVYVSSTSEGTISHGETHTNNAIDGTVTLPLSTSEIIYDVKILNLNKNEYGVLSITGLPEALDYELIDYTLGEKICEGSKCSLGASKTIKIKLKYKNGKYDASNTEYNFKLEFTFKTYHKINYVDIPTSGLPVEIIDGGKYYQTINPEFSKDIEVKSGEQPLVKGTDYTYDNNNLTINQVNNDITISNVKYQVGDYVKLGTEGFHVIKADESAKKLTMLAEWNLNVGNNTIDVPAGQEGMQNPACKAWINGLNESDWKCTVAFSENNYWSSTASKYPAWVYDGNDIIRPIINEYVKKLDYAGYKSVTGRLIKQEELISLGCSVLEATCNGAPEWVKNTTFWSGSAGTSDRVWGVNPDGDFGHNTHTDSNGGIRPVITINTSEIK